MDRDKALARQRRYRESHREKLRDDCRRYREENPEKVRASGRRWRETNPEKVRERKRRWMSENREKYRRQHLRYNYNMTLEEFEDRLIAQGYLCYLCEELLPEDRDLVVDHDHKLGLVRGLAHRQCNLIIGQVKDSPEMLRRLADNLEKASVS